MDKPRSRVLGVAEIVLNVRDLDTMEQFYEHVLGFEHHSHFPQTEPTIVFLTIKDSDTPLGRSGRHPQLFALIDARRHVFTRDTYQGIDPARSPLNHLAFEIAFADYEAERLRLEELGLHPRPLSFPVMRARALFFQDPEGNTLELICHDPEVAGDEVVRE